MTPPPPDDDQNPPGAGSAGGTFATSVMKMVGATTVAQLLALIASPIVTRLFGPEAYGVYAVFLSIIGTLVMVVCLRYEIPIVLPKQERDAASLLWLSVTMAAIVSLAITPVMVLFGPEIAGLFNAPGLAPWLLLVPPTLFAAGLFQALNYWNTRSGRFGRLSMAQVTRSVTIVGVQLAAGFAGFISGGSLIGSAFAGYIGATTVLGLLIWHDDRVILREGRNLPGIVWGMKRYRNFPLLDMWSAFLNTIASEVPVFLLATFFTTTVVGAYALGRTVLQYPMIFIGSSLSQVFFSTAASAKHAGQHALASVVEETEIRLVILGVLPFLILMVAGQEIFSVVFGRQWAEAGVYAQLLAPWIMITFVATPVSSLFSVLELQRSSLVLNIVALPARVGALAIGGYLGEPRVALALFSGVGVLYAVGSALYLVGKAGGSFRRILGRSRPYLLYTVPIVVMMIAVKFAFAATPIVIVAAAGLGMLPYYLIVVRHDPVLRSPIVHVLRACRIGVPGWLEA